MLVGLAGALSGYNGSYDFPSGAEYPAHVPYKTMRILLALPGIAMVPLAWGTAIELRFSKWATHIVTLMVLCGELCFNSFYSLCGALTLSPVLDTAWLVISRFILLDSMLLFFTFTTVYFLACFNNQQRRRVKELGVSRARTDYSFVFRPFEEDWWVFLTLTGISIGCVSR